MQIAYVWVWLLGAPGWFVATRTLGLGTQRAVRFEAVVMAAAAGLALATVLHLPAILLSGHPSRGGMFVTGLVSSLALVRFPVPASKLLRRPVPAPPLIFLVVLVAWMVARAGTAWNVAGPDAPYLHGMVRSLADTFPPPNPAACTRRIDQPWGYWMVDALAVAGGGGSIARTLGFACAVEGGLWLALAYVVVGAITGQARSAALTLPIALVGWEGRWLVESVAAGHWVPARVTGGDVQTFGGTLWNAMYDAPTLVLFLLVARFAVEAEPDAGEPGARGLRAAAIVPLLVVLAVFPFFHPASAMLAYASVAAWMIFWAGRGRLPKAAWLLPLCGAPFVVLYVHLYAPEVAPRMPFLFGQGIMRSVYFEVHGKNLLAYFALLLPLALAGLGWTRRGRVLLVVVAGVPLAVDLGSKNIANNYHWTYDPIAVALILAASVGAGELLRKRSWSASAVLLVLLPLMIVSARPWELATFLNVTPALTSDEARAAELLRASSAPGACLLAVARDASASRVVLAGADRRLYLEQPFHLDRSMDPQALGELVRTNEAMIDDPAAPLLARGALGGAFDYVVFTGGPQEAAWRARAAPVFSSDTVRVYAIDHPAP